MTIIVETGAGLANANSYISVADADTYFALRNNTAWNDLDPADEKAPYLAQAVDFMQQAYRQSWQGWRTTVVQALDWPRYSVKIFDSPGGYAGFPNYYDMNTIPQQIKDAQCLLALRVINGDLAPDIGRIEKRVKVGSIEVEYDPSDPAVTTFRAVEMLLAPFFEATGMQSRISRL